MKKTKNIRKIFRVTFLVLMFTLGLSSFAYAAPQELLTIKSLLDELAGWGLWLAPSVAGLIVVFLFLAKMKSRDEMDKKKYQDLIENVLVSLVAVEIILGIIKWLATKFGAPTTAAILNYFLA